MTIIEQLVEDFKQQNPSATPEQIKEYLQTLEPHTKVIKEDEWAFNTEHDDGTVSAETDEVTLPENKNLTSSTTE
jgi:hypothetical protein